MEEEPEAARLVRLMSPLMADEDLAALRLAPGWRLATLDACFAPENGEDGLVRGLDDLCAAAVTAIDEGHSVLVISDRAADEHRAPIPMLLAVSTVHHHLIREGRRSVLPKFRKVAAKSALSEDGPMTVVRRHLKRLRESARPRIGPRCLCPSSTADTTAAQRSSSPRTSPSSRPRARSRRR